MLLEVCQVEKKKGNFQLGEISFSLPEGFVMGLIGPNGSGKTTLLHMILGLYSPDRGNIRIGGMDSRSCEKEVKDQMGFVLAKDYFLDNITLQKNADMYGKYYSAYNPECFQEYCKRFTLEPQRKLKQLSKGERLKFQLAFAMSHNPKLLVLDEPTANFDKDFHEEFQKLLCDFVADGTRSVLIATHIMEELDRYADYITMLNKGKLVMCNSRQELEERYRVVTGEEYKLKLLPKEDVIYIKKGKYSCSALVHHSRYHKYDKELTLDKPTMEDFLYYQVKGEGV